MGDTQDLHNIISIIKNREPKTLMAGIGFSLGANVLTKWMGEMGVNSPLSCAVSISNPFNLEIASRSASKTTFGRFYEKRLVKLMQQRLKEKYADIPSSEILIDLNKAYAAETFRAFDTIVTAPLHQFSSLEDYYQKSSSCFRIKDIKKPMLFINAFDDPIIEPNALPIKERFPSTSTVEYYQTGGHVGFIQSSKKQPWKIESWLNNRILNYIYPFLYEQ